MITGLRIETKHDDTRVLHAIKENRKDQYQYLVELTPNKSNLNIGNSDIRVKTLLNSAGLNNPNLISYNFELRRGLYDVTISRVLEINGREIKTDPNTVEKYPEAVMVGESYIIQAKLEDAECYGGHGVRVRIRSREMPLDSQTMYYKIKRENLEHLKYYVPFHGSETIEFFIKGVRRDEVELNLGNPSFEIENL